jgi:hypothetical protein
MPHPFPTDHIAPRPTTGGSKTINDYKRFIAVTCDVGNNRLISTSVAPHDSAATVIIDKVVPYGFCTSDDCPSPTTGEHQRIQ